MKDSLGDRIKYMSIYNKIIELYDTGTSNKCQAIN